MELYNGDNSSNNPFIFRKSEERLSKIQFPKVSILTTNMIMTIPKNRFVWLEKTDGVYNILVIENKYVFRYYNNQLEDLNIFIDIDGMTVLECEYYENKWYIFDIVYMNNEDLRTYCYKDRMKKSRYIPENNYIMAKKYYTIDNWDNIFKFINNYKSSYTNHIIDGVIIQLIDISYGKPSAFKLKPKYLNTIDFRLKHINNNIFYLYSSGKQDSLKRNMKRLPLIDYIKNKDRKSVV